MTTPLPETPIPASTPTAEGSKALANSLSETEILSLAQEIVKAGSLGFDPKTTVKGVITAVNFAGSPPTVTIEISGSSAVQVADVHVLNNYSPVVGQTVLVDKQGADIVILGSVADLAADSADGGAGGWIKPTLAGGSHGGNSNGDIFYRRILDHGSWKMQWRGGWNVSGTFILNTGQALAAEYRPGEKRTVLASRQFQTGAQACQVDFHTDGRVEVTGMTQATLSGTVSGDISYVDPGDFTDFVSGTHAHVDGSGFITTSVTLGHDHGVIGGHDHVMSGGSHTHPVTTPTWVSLNGVEYFI
jgi:hypothetical protein